jgi:predicted DNA-binding transcriptional regulator AlpA
MDRLLTMQEVSARTGLAISTLYQLRQRGEGVACFRLRGRLRCRESALNEWLARAEAEEQARLNRLAGGAA